MIPTLLTVLGIVTIGLAAPLIYRQTRRRRLAARLRIGSLSGIDVGNFVQIGGIEQWITVRGEDRRNPVIVIFHGGPGQPYSVFAPQLRAWEKIFTLVQWDQRGSGNTLFHVGKEAMGKLSLERLQCYRAFNGARSNCSPKSRLSIFGVILGTFAFPYSSSRVNPIFSAHSS